MTARSLPAALYADLVGKPYAEGARGPAAYDCLGLAIELERRRGLAVPDFVSSEAELHRQLAAGGFLAGLEPISAPEAGALVLMRSDHAAKVHLGVMTDAFSMLHAAEAVGSVVRQRLADTFWKRRVLGFYRLGGAQ
jgi:cell wall-associated NlpC family hydrolase